MPEILGMDNVLKSLSNKVHYGLIDADEVEKSFSKESVKANAYRYLAIIDGEFIYGRVISKRKEGRKGEAVTFPAHSKAPAWYSRLRMGNISAAYPYPAGTATRSIPELALTGELSSVFLRSSVNVSAVPEMRAAGLPLGSIELTIEIRSSSCFPIFISNSFTRFLKL
jgi:hypothetical protein